VYDSRLSFQGRVSAPGIMAIADPRVVGLALAVFIGVVFVAGVAMGAIDLSHLHLAPFMALGAGPVADFVPSTATREKGEGIAKLRKQVSDIFAAHKKGDGYDMPAEKIAELRSLNDNITTAADAYDAAVTLEKQAFDNDLALKGLTNLRPAMPPDGGGAPGDGVGKARGFGEILATKSAELKSLANGGNGTVSFELSGAEYGKMRAAAGLKTLMTSSDIAPQADRQAVVPSAQYLSDVTDLFLPGNTDRDTIEFYEETTFTNAAAETAEGNAAPESALSFTLRTFAVREISTFVPVTRRALEDNAGLQSYVEGRLGHMIDLRRSSELMAGNGTPPNLKGILHTSGIQTQAKGSDPTPDAVYKAIVLARTTGDAEPTAVVFHAQDWQDIRLLRTIDGLYIWGSPSEVGPDRIWGLQARVSNSITQNTGLVGAFRPYAQLFCPRGRDDRDLDRALDVLHRAQGRGPDLQRLALAVYRPAAFVTITGI
jgi:HK97 family phage major capsid protein